MKFKLLRFCALLSLCAMDGIAQTSANVPGVFPNTNVIQSFNIGFAQGACNDGTNACWFGTQGILQLNSSYKYVGGAFANNVGITNGLANFVGLHLGDPDFYQGYVYSPMEDQVGAPQGSANIDIAIF